MSLVSRCRAAAATLTFVSFAAQAQTLSFSDGFEPDLSAWSSVQEDVPDTVEASPLFAWEGSHALRFIYKGSTTLANLQAAVTRTFSTYSGPLFLRFWLYVPIGHSGFMAPDGHLRIARLSDGAGAAKVWLTLKRSSGAPAFFFLQVDYDASSGSGGGSFGTASTTHVTEGTWHYVELAYEPASGTAKLFLDDPATPRAEGTGAVSHAVSSVQVGLAGSAMGDVPQDLAVYMDNVALSSSRLSTSGSGPIHFNELESGTLTVTQSPPGKAPVAASSTGIGLSAATGAHRGSYKLEVNDGSDGSTSYGFQLGSFAPVTGRSTGASGGGPGCRLPRGPGRSLPSSAPARLASPAARASPAWGRRCWA